jgi:hypothetical protein
MDRDIENLKAKLKRCTLLLGVLQITVGCMVGFIPPTTVQWFRGIVMAHIEFTANGVLMVVFAFLVMEMRLSATAFKVWFASLQIGTWLNGTTSPLMTTLNAKFPPPNGTDSALVSASLQLCGVTIMIALLMTLYGLFRAKDSAK